ncbi:MAG: hypothetical protein IT305_27890 [Chloroflexi bacterium]|nr:hypothetical protein [Chloroflexota bacterium]
MDHWLTDDVERHLAALRDDAARSQLVQDRAPGVVATRTLRTRAALALLWLADRLDAEASVQTTSLTPAMRERALECRSGAS